MSLVELVVSSFFEKNKEKKNNNKNLQGKNKTRSLITYSSNQIFIKTMTAKHEGVYEYLTYSIGHRFFESYIANTLFLFVRCLIKELVLDSTSQNPTFTKTNFTKNEDLFNHRDVPQSLIQNRKNKTFRTYIGFQYG